MHAGAYGLSLLSDPLDAQILRALEGGELPLIDLRGATGLPPQTTLRKHLQALAHQGLLLRTQAHEFPGPVTYRLTIAGQTLCVTAHSVEGWLASAPSGPMPLGQPGTKRAIKSLVDAWTTKMLRGLAAKPLSLTDLDRVLTGINYPALERRLTAMRLAGQVEAKSASGGTTPYRVTRWLREAVGPLAAAAHWESTHGPAECEPLGRTEVEALFLLAMPLIRVPISVNGMCSLVVDLSGGRQGTKAGVTVVMEGGRPVSCASGLHAGATSQAVASANDWLASLSPEGEPTVNVEGDPRLAEALVLALRGVCVNDFSDRSPIHQ